MVFAPVAAGVVAENGGIGTDAAVKFTVLPEQTALFVAVADVISGFGFTVRLKLAVFEHRLPVDCVATRL